MLGAGRYQVRDREYRGDVGSLREQAAYVGGTYLQATPPALLPLVVTGDDPGLVKRDAGFLECVAVGVESLLGDPRVGPARCRIEEWLAQEAYFPVPELEQVAHGLGCAGVVVHDDCRGRITQAPFNFNGRDASLQRELDIAGVHGRGEDNPVDTALEQRLDAFAFPVLISTGIEEQDVEALLRRCLLGADDDFGDEWVGQRSVQDQAESDRLTFPQFLGDNIEAVSAVTQSRLHSLTRFSGYIAVPVDHP